LRGDFTCDLPCDFMADGSVSHHVIKAMGYSDGDSSEAI
jgi:hypothetical protein